MNKMNYKVSVCTVNGFWKTTNDKLVVTKKTTLITSRN